MNHPQQQDKQGGQQHRCKVPKCPYRHDHPQQEAQSITVKPDTASVSANRASAGNRSNQKLTEVSSELDPQQQESWEKSLLLNFFAYSQTSDGEYVLHSNTDREQFEKLKAFISTERQRVLDEVRELVEGMKKVLIVPKGVELKGTSNRDLMEHAERVAMEHIKANHFERGRDQALDDLLSALKEMEQHE